MDKEYRVPMTEDNEKLQDVLNYFSDKAEASPGTFLLSTSSDGEEGYTLVLNPSTDEQGHSQHYSGPQGVRVDLDMSYEDVISKGMPMAYIRRASSLASPTWLQDGLARKDLGAELQISYDKETDTERNIADYSIIGDSVSEVKTYDLQDIKDIPEKYLEMARNIREGDDARKAVDLAFKLWNWDIAPCSGDLE